MRKIAISDIHGCAKTFRELILKLDLKKKDQLFLLGDYIDRGPDSRGVINYIFSLQEQGYDVRCLMGNHEHMLLEGFSDRYQNQMWLANGGRITLKSFRAVSAADITNKYLDFFRNCESHIISDEFIFVHAGLNLFIEDPLSDEHAMMWKRNWDLEMDYEWLGDRFVIHGHTPMDKSVIKNMANDFQNHRVMNIDNGVFRVMDSEKGSLCAFDLTNRQLYFQENLDLMEDYISNRI